MTVPADLLIACSDFVVMGFPEGKSILPKCPSLAPPVMLYDALLPVDAGVVFVLAVQYEAGLSYFGVSSFGLFGVWYLCLLGLSSGAGHDGPAHSFLCLRCSRFTFQWLGIIISF